VLSFGLQITISILVLPFGWQITVSAMGCHLFGKLHFNIDVAI